jgi:hypothetical protein
MANTEWWQRGPVEGVPALLQPVAHILLQVRESVNELTANLTESEWNARPANVASSADVAAVLDALSARVGSALAELRTIDPSTLGDFRAVGRAKLPSTVIGCLVHGAEHSMRHVGQLSVTTRIVRAGETGA